MVTILVPEDPSRPCVIHGAVEAVCSHEFNWGRLSTSRMGVNIPDSGGGPGVRLAFKRH